MSLGVLPKLPLNFSWQLGLTRIMHWGFVMRIASTIKQVNPNEASLVPITFKEFIVGKKITLKFHR
ncbi:hypothetical protein, partial [Saccharicrinis sp. GN24d3]|uniref:hypothetical protein n=1 Tax=Saccharicrinis sp. GN24d3 TaxID=3458416 RepID=UPI00403585C1